MNNQVAASSTRSYWVQTMLRIADPVVEALADNKLRASMPVENKKKSSANTRIWKLLHARS